MQSEPKADYIDIETLMRQGMLFNAVRKSLAFELFDMLEGHGKTAAQVADALSFQQELLQSLLRMFAASGILVQEGDTYRNSPLASEFLVSSAPAFQGKSLELHQRFNDFVVDNMEQLLRGEQGKQDHFSDKWGQEDAMEGTAQYARLGSLQDTSRFFRTLSGFESMQLMGDIGGNHGEFCMAALDANPALSGEILDLPGVVETLGPRIAKRGYADRMRAACCDLRSDRLEPGRYDLLLASHILYGFVDQLNTLAAMMHDALKSGGWFVSHHLRPENSLPAENIAALDFVTKLAGYKSHFLDPDLLQPALEEAGFTRFRTQACGAHSAGLLLAAQKTV